MMPRDRLTWPLEAFVSGDFKANKTTPKRATGVLRGPHLEEEARAGPAVWAAGSKIPSKLEHDRKGSLGLTPKKTTWSFRHGEEVVKLEFPMVSGASTS